MKKKLVVAIVVLVIAGLLGSFVGLMTTIPLQIRDPGYRMAIALEQEYPFLDVWEIRSEGEFIFVSILWLNTPPRETIREVADTVNEFIVEYRTDEKRVIFRDIIQVKEMYGGHPPTYMVVSMLSCEAKDFGKGEPVHCQIWPWPLQTKPEAYPWVGPSSIWK